MMSRDLDAELVRSLFCGLPHLEKRVAVFLSASDETSGEGIFHHVGYIAPVNFGVEEFTPRWRREVLDAHPSIDGFHVTELRSRKWRDSKGITEDQAEEKIDAAVNLIAQYEELISVRASINEMHLRAESFGLKFRLNDAKRAPVNFVADYVVFCRMPIRSFCPVHYASRPKR